ncbi:MAG: transcription-repair coupling factor, partial [Spirochaetales bacterium]|nr:transcription-repair coupling factor [Spirochaetales bacterium]
MISRLGKHAGMKELCDALRLGGLPRSVRGPKSSFVAFLLAKMHADSGRPFLVVVPNESEAAALRSDLALFGVDAPALPSWGTGAYATPSSNAAVWGQRMRPLVDLFYGRQAVTVAPLRAVSHKLPPPKHSMRRTVTIEAGRSCDPTDLSRRLTDMGYWRVPRVSVHGEFALRGEVLDVFLPGWDEAVRIVFDYDEVAEIRLFDP